MSDETTAPTSVHRPRPAIFSLLPWFAVAGFVALAAVLGQRLLVYHSEAALLREQAALAAIELKTARNEIAAEQILARHQLDSVDPRSTSASPGLPPADDLAGLKITVLASRLKNSPLASAVAVWNPAKQEGVLQVNHLPMPAAGQDYRLWIIGPPLADPVDGGVFAVEAPTGGARVKFTGRQPVATVEAFVVTLERKGGAPNPEGPFVLFGK